LHLLSLRAYILEEVCVIKNTIRQVGDVTIVDIQGRITLLGGGSGCLREMLAGLVKEGHKKVILNLAETSYIDSSGIGELVNGFTSLCNCGAQLKLLALTKRVEDLLRITKLYIVFDVYKDEAEAVRSFS
jgi:anti-sigma B factor antagonist